LGSNNTLVLCFESFIFLRSTFTLCFLSLSFYIIPSSLGLNLLFIYAISSLYTSGCPWPSDTMKSPCSPSMSWKSCAKIEIPHPENHIIKFSGFGLGNHECENLGPKVEIPSPENHVLKTIS
jgi:hypothetical protein